jgi:hypothetical protein
MSITMKSKVRHRQVDQLAQILARDDVQRQHVEGAVKTFSLSLKVCIVLTKLSASTEPGSVSTSKIASLRGRSR